LLVVFCHFEQQNPVFLRKSGDAQLVLALRLFLAGRHTVGDSIQHRQILEEARVNRVIGEVYQDQLARLGVINVARKTIKTGERSRAQA
jgi:hypothetical protein